MTTVRLKLRKTMLKLFSPGNGIANFKLCLLDLNKQANVLQILIRRLDILKVFGPK